MKRQYITPAIQIIELRIKTHICAYSIEGVEGTESFRTTVSDEETDEYLSRDSWYAWEDDEHE